MRDIKYTLLIVLVFSVFSGCKKDLAGLNENPNDQTSINPDYLFKQSLKEGAGSYNSDVNVEQWGLMNWVMYLAARGGVISGNEYVIPSGKDAFWNEQYINALMQIQEVINVSGSDENMVNKKSASRIWKVFLFHRLTDLWGAVPYYDALKGYSDLNYAPGYDQQHEIYLNMLDELKNAALSFNSSAPFFNADADLIFSGDINSWIRFANSLRLRLATRIKNADHDRYLEEIADLSGKDLISSNEQSALFPFNGQKKNHLYEAWYTNQAAAQNNPSKFLVDMLVSTNDPRISVILEKTVMSIDYPWYDEYQGIPNLLPNTDPVWSTFDDDWRDVSAIGNWFLRDNTPGVLFSYAEVCFLLSEASLDGAYSLSDAQTLLNSGIRANMEFYNLHGDGSVLITSEQIDSFLLSITTCTLEDIITQKWLSFVFENGYEAYAEYRRTGFPVLKKYDGTEIEKSIFPKRFIYPNSETTLNRENYLKAISVQGADNEFTKLWWNN